MEAVEAKCGGCERSLLSRLGWYGGGEGTAGSSSQKSWRSNAQSFKEWTGLRVLMQNQPPIMSRTELVLSITTREDGTDNEQSEACAVHYL
jgi:hypothetical protein